MILYEPVISVLLAVMNKFLRLGTHFQFNASVAIIMYLNSHLGVYGDRNSPVDSPTHGSVFAVTSKFGFHGDD